MSTSTYPHLCVGGTDTAWSWLCRCGQPPDEYSAETARGPWGADCPAAMRERIGELERERDEARTTALHEAAAVLRRLSDDYAAGHRDHYDYCRVLSVATARIEVLTTTTDRSDDADR